MKRGGQSANEPPRIDFEAIVDALTAWPYSFSYEEIGQMTPRQTFRLLRRLSDAGRDDQDAEDEPDVLPPPPDQKPKPKGGPRVTRMYQAVRGLGFEKFDCFRFTAKEQELSDQGIDPATVEDAAPRELVRERFYTMSQLVGRTSGLPAVKELGLEAVDQKNSKAMMAWCDRVWQANEEKYQRTKAEKEKSDAVSEREGPGDHGGPGPS